jgi:hypothetical protein
MESLHWALQTHGGFAVAGPLLLSLAVGFIIAQSDFLLLLLRHFTNLTIWGRPDRCPPGQGGWRPSGLVIIPSLLRNDDDLDAITTTVASCATNEYPGKLVIIASVDGRTEKPALFRRLNEWVSAQDYPSNVSVYVGGTETRLGKMMAVEAGVTRMKELVAAGEHPRFPSLYFSIDGDGTLGPHALELLATRLATPHPLTRNPRRVVSGKICIRPDLFWKNWASSFLGYFTIRGYIHLQVAREFLLSNIARFNWKLTPKIGIPGALYCTWTEVLLNAPRYMGFMKTLRFRDWIRWWLGHPPPCFSTTEVEPSPEALTGASDDTCIAFLSSIGSWHDGKLSFDAPRTPLHALVRLFRGYIFERSHDYEPEARVYTYTPSTFRGLWKQRVRWNSSRFECAGRFWRAFAFHWEIGLPTASHLWMVLKHVIELTLYYFVMPYLLFRSSRGVLTYLLGYFVQFIAYSIYTVLALVLEREWRRYWPVLLSLPLAPLHQLTINFFGCAYGVTKDVFLFGNQTNFAPEWTLIKGKTARIAILFRIRRFLALCVRSAVVGDVPFGGFWFGWRETAWTPNGFEGWTTGKRSPSMLTATWRAFRVKKTRRIEKHTPILVDRSAAFDVAAFIGQRVELQPHLFELVPRPPKVRPDSAAPSRPDA